MLIQYTLWICNGPFSSMFIFTTLKLNYQQNVKGFAPVTSCYTLKYIKTEPIFYPLRLHGKTEALHLF